MTKITVSKDKNNPYLVMDKRGLQDTRLSWKAKGILAYLLSLPNDWQIYLIELVKHCTDWRDSTMNGIKELESFWYITKKRVKDDKWQFSSVDYTIYEKPPSVCPKSDYPMLDNPKSDNPPLLRNNYNKVITKLNNNSKLSNIKATPKAVPSLEKKTILKDPPYSAAPPLGSGNGGVLAWIPKKA